MVGDFIAELDKFLGRLPKGWPYGVELRNRDWLRPDHFECLSRHHWNGHSGPRAANGVSDRILFKRKLEDFDVNEATTLAELRTGRCARDSSRLIIYCPDRISALCEYALARAPRKAETVFHENGIPGRTFASRCDQAGHDGCGRRDADLNLLAGQGARKVVVWSEGTANVDPASK